MTTSWRCKQHHCFSFLLYNKWQHFRFVFFTLWCEVHTQLRWCGNFTTAAYNKSSQLKQSKNYKDQFGLAEDVVINCHLYHTHCHLFMGSTCISSNAGLSHSILQDNRATHSSSSSISSSMSAIYYTCRSCEDIRAASLAWTHSADRRASGSWSQHSSIVVHSAANVYTDTHIDRYLSK